MKYGIRVPKDTEEAYKIDRDNNNTLWSEAINKEVNALNSYKTFKFVNNNDFKSLKKEGFQFAKLRMIFDVKEDLRRKARLVIGGHTVDSTGHEVYASVMKQHSSRIIEIIAEANNLEILVGDIGNAYLYAKTREKIFTRCDQSFIKAGITSEDKTLAIVEKALYGLPTSGNRWHNKLSSSLITMGFKPSKGDQNVWYRRSAGLYDYIGRHTDDLMVASKNAKAIMDTLQKTYDIKKIGPPGYHLVCDYFQTKGRNGKIKWKIGSATYVKECVAKVAKILSIELSQLHNQNKPLNPDYKPELDNSPILEPGEQRIFQQLIGIGLWVQSIGRIDIAFAVASLSRFSTQPRKDHLGSIRNLFEYLKTFPDKRLIIEPQYNDDHGEVVKPPEGHKSFNQQYPDAFEQNEATHPKPLGVKLKTSVWFDANHAHDQVTRRSISVIIVYVGGTPITWKSRRQTAIYPSTYGAELCAGRVVTEEAIGISFLLRWSTN